MAQTIQIKRFNASGETPASRGTQLAWGEMAINEAENALWYGLQAGGEALLSRDVLVEPPTPADPSAPGALWFDTTGNVLNVWTGTAWEPAADVSAGATTLGALTDVTITSASSGQVLRYNGSEWVNAQLDYSDLSGTPTNVSSFTNDSGYLTSIGPLDDHTDVVLTSPANGEVLKYNGSNWVNDVDGGGGGGGTYAIDESSRTADGDWLTFYTSGGADRMQFKTNGYAGNDPDWVGENNGYGGYQFSMASPTNQQILFEDATDGVNLIGYHAEIAGESGLNLIGKGFEATGATIRLKTNNKVGLKTTNGSVEMPELPTTDPGNTNEVWADNGVLVLSGSTAGGGGGAVDSVNDQTGVVSLGIQDMNDYALSPTVNTVYRYDAVSDGGSCAEMEVSFAQYQGTTILGTKAYDETNGQLITNLGTIAQNWEGFNYSTVSASGPFTSSGSVTKIPNQFGCGGVTFITNVSAGIGAATTVWVSEYDPNATAEIPLADGDVLQWVDGDQKFKPSALNLNAAIHKQIDFEGALSGTPQSKRIYAPRDCSGLSVIPYLSTFSSGLAVQFNIRIDGTVVTTGSVANSTLVGDEVTYDSSITKGSYITIDVTEAGSGAVDLALVVTLL